MEDINQKCIRSLSDSALWISVFAVYVAERRSTQQHSLYHSSSIHSTSEYGKLPSVGGVVTYKDDRDPVDSVLEGFQQAVTQHRNESPLRPIVAKFSLVLRLLRFVQYRLLYVSSGWMAQPQEVDAAAQHIVQLLQTEPQRARQSLLHAAQLFRIIRSQRQFEPHDSIILLMAVLYIWNYDRFVISDKPRDPSSGDAEILRIDQSMDEDLQKKWIAGTFETPKQVHISGLGVLNGRDSVPRILRESVHALVVQFMKSNPWFWHLLLDSEEVDPSSSYSRGSPEEAKITLHYPVKTWRETNGAIDLVEELAYWAFDTFKELLLLLPGHWNAKGEKGHGRRVSYHRNEKSPVERKPYEETVNFETLAFLTFLAATILKANDDSQYDHANDNDNDNDDIDDNKGAKVTHEMWEKACFAIRPVDVDETTEILLATEKEPKEVKVRKDQSDPNGRFVKSETDVLNAKPARRPRLQQLLDEAKEAQLHLRAEMDERDSLQRRAMATGAIMSTTAAKAAMAPWGQIEPYSDDELALKKPNGKERFNSVPLKDIKCTTTRE
ncbi:hypothetical protein HFD88_005474 [Aspergillus terreus]|nr:hypothetical protein HFD88_005474 [Aspergillus terreus]